MFCSNCGTEIPEGAKECANCGKKLASTPAEVVDKYSVLGNKLIENTMNRLAVIDWESGLAKTESFMNGLGVIAFYLLGVIGLISGIVNAIRYDWHAIWLGLISLVVCFFLPYFGVKMLGRVRQLALETKASFGSKALLDCLAVLFSIGSIASLVCGIVYCCKLSSFDILWEGIIGFLVLAYAAIAAMKPAMIGVDMEEGCSPAQELIGIMTFGLKIVLRIVPFVWCIGTVAVVINIICHLGANNLMDVCAEGFLYGVGLGSLPIIAYLGFLLFFFFIDIAKAILTLHNKKGNI